MRSLLLVGLSIILPYCLVAQDSTYFNVLWSPKELYRKAGVRQEGVFMRFYKDDVPVDSVLVNVKFYDSLGRVTRQNNYHENKIRYKYSCFYSGNQLDSMVEEQVWLADTLVHKYQYNAAGQLLFMQSYNGTVKTTQRRYVYNPLGQPLQFFSQIGEGKEYLSSKFTYRSDNLIKKIYNFFPKTNKQENFSYIYSYEDDNKKTTRSIQREGNWQPIIDCIRTYNEEQQLIKKLSYSTNMPVHTSTGMSITENELEEISSYLQNGMLDERVYKKNGKITQVEKHYYH